MGKSEILKELVAAYAAELETVQNYIACSVNPDGVRSEVIKKALAADVETEIAHAQRLAGRIKTIGGTVPGSLDLPRNQRSLQPPADTTDLVSVIKGVIEAEEQAIAQYQKIILLCEGNDYVTQDLVIEILGNEEEHRREFVGFLKEYEGSTKSQRGSAKRSDTAGKKDGQSRMAARPDFSKPRSARR